MEGALEELHHLLVGQLFGQTVHSEKIGQVVGQLDVGARLTGQLGLEVEESGPDARERAVEHAAALRVYLVLAGAGKTLEEQRVAELVAIGLRIGPAPESGDTVVKGF